MKPLSINLRPESLLKISIIKFIGQTCPYILKLDIITFDYNLLNSLEKSLLQKHFNQGKNMPVNLISKKLKKYKHYPSQGWQVVSLLGLCVNLITQV